VLRWLALVFVLLLIGLQVKLWTDSGGLPEVAELEQAVAAQREQNRELSLRNEALAAEVSDLKEGDAAVEERARAELGLILPDEVFYRVIEPATQETDD
jgi:cell division protein FtsB